MKKLLILLLLIPTTSFSQSEELMDSVNYYFSILLNNERDSINQANSKNPEFISLNKVIVETDRSKFINPDKHIEQCFEDLSKKGVCDAHSTTNKENSFFDFNVFDKTYHYSNPKVVAEEFFKGWKNSPRHYDFMVNSGGWEQYPYKTFIIRYKMVYNQESDNMIKFRLVATYTGFFE